jgi:hypothetical protein
MVLCGSLPAPGAPGDITTTNGLAGYLVKTDFGGGGKVKGDKGAHALNWNANGTWSGMDASGSWGGTGKMMWVAFDPGVLNTLINNVLGVTAIYNTRPATTKVKYKPAKADKDGSIAFWIKVKTHTTVQDKFGPEEGHIYVKYIAKYKIPAGMGVVPKDLETDTFGTIKVQSSTKDPTTGERVDLGKEVTAGTVNWNANGSFTYGTLIQNGTWAKDAKGKLVLNISQADAQRLSDRMKAPGAPAIVVTGHEASGKVSIKEDEVRKLKLKIYVTVDSPGLGVTDGKMRFRLSLRGAP